MRRTMAVAVCVLALSALHLTAAVTVSPSSKELDIGQSWQFTSDSGSGVKWTSSNPWIASVTSSGVVTGISPGQATITARKGNQYGTAQTIIRVPASDPSCTTTTNGSFSDTQAKIDAASDGDVVCIPAGTFTWTGEASVVNVTNKNIWIKGAGIDTTTITMAADGSGTPNYAWFIRISNSTHGNFRLSHMTIGGTFDSGNGAVIGVFSNTFSEVVAPERWRIDHIKFAVNSGSAPTGVTVEGANYGLIDHLEANPWRAGVLFRGIAGVNSDFSTSPFPLAGDLTNTQPTDYGTDKFVVVEDCTFTFDWSEGNSVVFDASSGGGRWVIRNNTFTNALFYNHWVRSEELSAQVVEVYRNTITGTSTAVSGWNSYPGQWESGTGVVWGNQVSGYGETQSWLLTERRGAGEETTASLLSCNGTHAWDGNIEGTGWPCLGQIGRAPGKSIATIVGGSKQTSEPFHFWSNGVEATCKTGGACTDSLTPFVGAAYANFIKATTHSNGDVDYIRSGTTPKAGYTPLVYPHPRQSALWPY